jgi:hypothetical protein
MKELTDLALIGALLLVSISVIYCADAILDEMAKQRNLLEIMYGVGDGVKNNGSYSQGLKPSSSDSLVHSDAE